MIGIQSIYCHICEDHLDNLARMARYEASETLVRDKTGFLAVARKRPDEDTSDLCTHAVRGLLADQAVDPEQVECLIVVTQNPDSHGLPHTSAIAHGKLGLAKNCAAFDISLGCSGFVYALSVAIAFMAANEMTCGLLVTADPYSKVIDENDRDTAMLFGDAAAATLLSDKPQLVAGAFDFGTSGAGHEHLIIKPDGKLYMNGRQVFNFSAKEVPSSLQAVLEKNRLTLDEIDQVILHQGSRYIVETIGKRIGAPEKTKFFARDYGNTVSSSIPILLSQDLDDAAKTVLISGFGVGLSWASTVLTRQELGTP